MKTKHIKATGFLSFKDNPRIPHESHNVTLDFQPLGNNEVARAEMGEALVMVKVCRYHSESRGENRWFWLHEAEDESQFYHGHWLGPAAQAKLDRLFPRARFRVWRRLAVLISFPSL